MPFLLERVIEVGPGLSGGREWDVRMVRPRASSKVRVEATTLALEGEATESMVESDEEVPEEQPKEQDGWEMVCRPKVGIKVIGGGFIAVWRKMRR